MAAAVARLRETTPRSRRSLAEAGRRRVEADFDAQRSYGRLSAEMRSAKLRAGPDRDAGCAWAHSGGMAAESARLRWRLRDVSPRVAGALVYHGSVLRRRRRGAGRAGDHRGGARTAPAAPAALVPAGDRVAASRRDARARGTAGGSDRGHLRRRSREPCEIWRRRCSVASAARPRSFSPAPGGHTFWWQRLQVAADRGLDPRPPLAPRACRRRPAVARGPRSRSRAAGPATARRGRGVARG